MPRPERLDEHPRRPSETVRSSSLEYLEAGELFQKMTRLMRLDTTVATAGTDGSEVEEDDPELEDMA